MTAVLDGTPVEASPEPARDLRDQARARVARAVRAVRRAVLSAAVGRWVFRGAFVMFVLAIAAAYAVPLWYQVHNERILVVTSGSMAPAFNAGDAIIVREVQDASELRVGQVVTFTYTNEYTGDARLETHRIVDFVSLPETYDNGTVKLDPTTGLPRMIKYIQTKGDGNPTVDAQRTEVTKIRGIVRSVKRGWGFWLGWAEAPAGRLLLFAPPLLMLLLAELWSWRSERTVRRLRRLRRLRAGRTSGDGARDTAQLT